MNEFMGEVLRGHHITMIRGVISRGAGGALAPPDFGTSKLYGARHHRSLYLGFFPGIEVAITFELKLGFFRESEWSLLSNRSM